MRNARLYGLGIILGLLLFEGLLRLLSPLLGPPLTNWNTMQDAKLYKLENLDATLSPDIFVLGNSTALIGVNPSVISSVNPDMQVFNFAMNGSDSLSMVRLATDEIIPKYNAKELILFFSKGSFREDSDFSNHVYELAQPRHGQKSLISKVMSESYFYRYRNMIRDPMVLNSLIRSLLSFSTDQGIVARWASDLDESGYSLLANSDTQISGGWDGISNQKELHAEIQLPAGTVADLEYLKSFVNSGNISITLATVPTTSYDPTYRLTVEKLAQLFRFNFIQGNDAAYSGELFQDGVHLNSRGAEVFSRWLAERI